MISPAQSCKIFNNLVKLRLAKNLKNLTKMKPWLAI